MTRPAEVARRTLSERLQRLAALDVWPNCHGSDAPMSDDADERAEAARWCPGCPVFDECGAVAPFERFGIWGGHDRTPRSRSTAQHDEEGTHR